MNFKFDRTAFSAHSHEDEEKGKVHKHKSYKERLEIAFYLNSIAYNFDRNNPPKMDRSIFSVRRQ